MSPLLGSRRCSILCESRYSRYDTGSPLWVKSVALTARRPLPVHPDEQTFSMSVGMPQRGQQRTHAPQQTASVAISVVDDFSARLSAELSISLGQGAPSARRSK